LRDALPDAGRISVVVDAAPFDGETQTSAGVEYAGKSSGTWAGVVDFSRALGEAS
jgi:hypothetical protein